LFLGWLQHAGPAVSGLGVGPGGGAVVAGRGAAPARSPRRINGVLTAVRLMVVHAVAAGQAAGDVLPLLYEVADDRDLPAAARDTDTAVVDRDPECVAAGHRRCSAGRAALA